MQQRHFPLPRVGTELVTASHNFKPSASELLTQLFPYVREAARRMSTRAISRWLKENHDLDVSHTSVARALRESEKYWEGFAEFIEPAARIAADASGVGIKAVLQDEMLLEHLTAIPELAGETQEEVADNLDELREAVRFLEENWFTLDKATRNTCQRYFSNEEEEEEKQ